VEASSSHLMVMQGDVEYVIWSQTGKRMAALAARAGRDEIIFTAAPRTACCGSTRSRLATAG